MTENMQRVQRKDKGKISLRKGEQQRPNGTFAFRWTGEDGKRHAIYAETLEELRDKEQGVTKDQCDNIKTEARYVTINDMFALWSQLKRGLKDNTFQNYRYMYTMYVQPQFGKKRISSLVKSDVKRFYNTLVDEKCLAISTIDNIHTVLHQVLSMAVDDSYIRHNPADNVLKELKQAHGLTTEKRISLTVAEQNLFLGFLKRSSQYRHWYPIFAVMLGTGMRVGETVGLRWSDIDLNESIIDINHTLIYYNHATNGCYFNVHSPKTKAGTRCVPMLDFVREAFLEEQRYQQERGIRCEAQIDGYTDFIFVNRFGHTQHQGTLNKALKRIIRDCNDEVLLSGESNPILLPPFSCHNLRHTFTTRMCEAGVNIKVIQDTLGHADVSTTLNIYADATRDLKKSEFSNLDAFWNQQKRI